MKNRRSLYNIDLGASVYDSLVSVKEGPYQTLYLGNNLLAVHSLRGNVELSKSVNLGDKGVISFNPLFFDRTNLPKRKGTDSRTLAKGFFEINGVNHAILMQSLETNSSTSEHYHSLTECIGQFLGKSLLETRPVEDDTNFRVKEMDAGDKFEILPNKLHFLKTADNFSITIPIKATIEGLRDHHSIPKSKERMKQEIGFILSATGYQSGNEITGNLIRYQERLGNDEADIMLELIKSLAAEQSTAPLESFLSQ